VHQSPGKRRPKLILDISKKQQEYDGAMAEAKATAIKETSPITDKQLNWMNAVASAFKQGDIAFLL